MKLWRDFSILVVLAFLIISLQTGCVRHYHDYGYRASTRNYYNHLRWEEEQRRQEEIRRERIRQELHHKKIEERRKYRERLHKREERPRVGEHPPYRH